MQCNPSYDLIIASPFLSCKRIFRPNSDLATRLVRYGCRETKNPVPLIFRIFSAALRRMSTNLPPLLTAASFSQDSGYQAHYE